MNRLIDWVILAVTDDKRFYVCRTKADTPTNAEMNFKAFFPNDHFVSAGRFNDIMDVPTAHVVN